MSVEAELLRHASLIRQLQGALGGMSISIDGDGRGLRIGTGLAIRWGTGSNTWTAAVDAAAVNVAHGLTRTPIAAGAFTRDKLLAYPVTARDATNITVQGFVTSNVVTTATRTFDWIVIG